MTGALTPHATWEATEGGACPGVIRPLSHHLPKLPKDQSEARHGGTSEPQNVAKAHHNILS